MSWLELEKVLHFLKTSFSLVLLRNFGNIIPKILTFTGRFVIILFFLFKKIPNISDYSIFYCFNLFVSLKIFGMFQIKFLCFLIMFVFVFIGYLVFSMTYRYSNCFFFFFTCKRLFVTFRDLFFVYCLFFCF